MSSMSRLAKCFLLTVVCVSLCSASVFGFTIEEIQYTTVADGASPKDGNIVDCAGGIVIGKYSTSQPRLQIYDPDDPNGWGAIQIKDWSSGAILVNAVSLGDWISFTDIMVEDHRETTFLQYDPDDVSPDVAYTIESNGNSLPVPLVVAASEIAAPTFISEDSWKVAADHSAEKYESMLLKVMDVSVTQIDMGAKGDIYNLQTSGGDNIWAADYLNADATGDYDAKVSVGQSFESVTGMLEQYAKSGTGYDWDYYQLLTRSTNDLVIPEPASMLLLACGAFWLVSRRKR